MHITKIKRWLGAAAGGIGLIFWASGVGQAGEWRLEQLTVCSEGRSRSPQIKGDGTALFFISDCNLVGDNPNRQNQIFRWVEGNFVQLTQVRDCRLEDLALSPDGRRLAFSTDCRLEGQNPGREFEIAVLAESGEIHLVSEGRRYSSRRPSWSPDGRYVVFESAADLTGSNPNNTSEIFAADLGSNPPALTQLTSSPQRRGGCWLPQMAGGAVVALCDADLAGTGPAPGPVIHYPEGVKSAGNPDHNPELISASLSGEVRQLTFTQGCVNGPAALRPSGNLIAFLSTCGFGDELRWKNRAMLYFLNGELRPALADQSLEVQNLTWSRDGRRLALSSNFSDGRINPERNREIFILEVKEREKGGEFGRLEPGENGLRPVTDFRRGTSDSPALSRDGKTVVFVSTADPWGKNSDGQAEIFLGLEIEEKE